MNLAFQIKEIIFPFEKRKKNREMVEVDVRQVFLEHFLCIFCSFYILVQWVLDFKIGIN
jgi:hypothetical protein